MSIANIYYNTIHKDISSHVTQLAIRPITTTLILWQLSSNERNRAIRGPHCRRFKILFLF